MPSRLVQVVRGGAVGAVVAQVWQAVGSFGLQLLAAWLLGASGLGLLSLCLSIIVLVTAVASGMVGDSLVILDRHDRSTRGGLQFWALAIALASLLLVVVGMTVSGLLTGLEAVLLGLALVAFQLEELVRRVFMVTLRYWRLVIIDGVAVAVAIAIVLIWSASRPPEITTFLIGLLVGQSLAIVVGAVMLPAHERRLVSLRGAGIRQVAGFGAWRGLQISVAPAVLTAMRVIVTAAAGAAALGLIELARIFVAPAMLSIQGLGSYLLSTYARDKQLPLATLLRRAWRASLVMVGATLVAGVAIVALAPWLSDRFAAPGISIDRFVVAGWVLYVAASASCQPFGSLAAARGRPARVLQCRAVDAALVVILLPVLLATGASASWTPFVLAGGLFVGGVLVRQFALKPLSIADKGRSAEVPMKRYSHVSR